MKQKWKENIEIWNLTPFFPWPTHSSWTKTKTKSYRKSVPNVHKNVTQLLVNYRERFSKTLNRLFRNFRSINRYRSIDIAINWKLKCACVKEQDGLVSTEWRRSALIFSVWNETFVNVSGFFAAPNDRLLLTGRYRGCKCVLCFVFVLMLIFQSKMVSLFLRQQAAACKWLTL